MPRKFSGSKLVIASHNQGKVAEIKVLLADYVDEVLSADDLNLPEPEETGLTFAENAELKARAGAQASGQIVLADDSGLAVNALDGAPGIYSARWAGPEKDFNMAMERVHTELGDKSRDARFVCCLTLAWPDGHVETVEGEVKGAIVWPPRGDAGFGYDPVFVPNGDTRSFAEMSSDEKKAISHRSDAFQKLIEKCFEN